MAMMGSGVGARREPRRAKRPRRPSPSPLLEDINLSGAHGMLVNVTAGMDLSIGEFQEVGDTVKQFASEDATVVVGYRDRSGACATRSASPWWRPGIGRPSRRGARAPSRREVRTSQTVAAAGAGAEPPMRVGRPTSADGGDYAALDKPAVQRQRAVGDGLRRRGRSDDVLDIPAFLRRQAD